MIIEKKMETTVGSYRWISTVERLRCMGLNVDPWVL